METSVNPEKHSNEYFTAVLLTCCSLFWAMRSSTSSIFSWITSWYTWFICRQVSGSCGRLSMSLSLLSASPSTSLSQIRHLGKTENNYCFKSRYVTIIFVIQHLYCLTKLIFKGTGGTELFVSCWQLFWTLPDTVTTSPAPLALLISSPAAVWTKAALQTLPTPYLVPSATKL